jgi:hypothetical protein
MNQTLPVPSDPVLARRIVDDGIRRYFNDRHRRVRPFVDRNFSLRGSLSLHRAAVGWDIARAPLNLTMAGPQVGLIAAAQAARKLGLPRVASRLGNTLRQRLEEAMSEYTRTRAAATEITTALFSLSAGAMALRRLTPGAISLGPTLASAIAQRAAVMSFPMGSALGSIWYTMFPVAPSAVLVAGLTGGLLAASTVAAAFAGVIADPVQRRLGLHERRLHRMLDALERQMFDPKAQGFVVHDHYVARLLDLFDITGALVRLAVR